jgi:hypothetical protein
VTDTFCFQAGHAMRAADQPKTQTAVAGKAMQGLEQGEVDRIRVVVTLQ